MNNETVQFGEHMVYDAYGCPFEILNDEKLCEKILLDLCDLAGMHALSKPFILSTDGNTALEGKDPGGFSGFMIIEESHISVHTFVKRGYVTIDLYSCKEFNTNKPLAYLNNLLKPQNSDVLKMTRGLKYPKENIY